MISVTVPVGGENTTVALENDLRKHTTSIPQGQTGQDDGCPP